MQLEKVREGRGASVQSSWLRVDSLNPVTKMTIASVQLCPCRGIGAQSMRGREWLKIAGTEHRSEGLGVVVRIGFPDGHADI